MKRKPRQAKSVEVKPVIAKPAIARPKYAEGWWMNYLHSIKEHVKRELTDKEVKDIMKLYISGVSIDKAKEEI